MEKDELIRFPIQFSKLCHLTIGYELSNINLICPRLEYLTTLYIQCLDCQVQTLLQTLINHAPRLQTIMFYKNNWLYFFLASQSVRRIIIRDGIYYNIQQCMDLCTSTLFNQCEILEMNIRTRSSVLDFLRKIPNLRVLTFKCEHDNWKENQIVNMKNDELIKWLKPYLPSGCVIKREEYGTIRLWIR